jgi:hypothetical protein
LDFSDIGMQEPANERFVGCLPGNDQGITVGNKIRSWVNYQRA